jgi:cephalosporin hydroxylase
MIDYNYTPSIFSLENYLNSDLGIDNAINLLNIVKSLGSDNTFVDMGVWHGFTSHILLSDAKEKNNKVFGVDVKYDDTDKSILDNTNYTALIGDSSTLGKIWQNGPVSLIFIDTFHVKEQVLCELYHWYQHVKEGGWIVFHDTNWSDEKHDTFGGIIWDRPEEAIKLFFNIKDLNCEDNYIKSINNDISNGMTFIQIKKKTDYISRIDWKEIFDRRNHLVSLFNFSHIPGFIVEKF